MKKQLKHCLLCGRELATAVTWLMFVEKFPPTICERCDGRFDRIGEAMNLSQKEHISLFTYNEAMQDYLHRYKFMKDVVLAKVFHKELHEFFRTLAGIVVPIPLHPEKLQDRTFAQVDELLIQAHIPFTHVLKKRTTDTQHTKTRSERLATPQLFEVTTAVLPKHYIVFDDIYTTGTTIEHAKKALLEAGAKSVSSVSLIRG